MDLAEPGTAARILDAAETLIETRGYSAFSYQDIAVLLGIRKASIHYHFANKAVLGVAVVERYAAGFAAAMAALAADPARSAGDCLRGYAAPYHHFAATADRVCLCGALAGEILALPPEMAARVGGFFVAHQAWLATILARGVASGEFILGATPALVARLIFDSLQGALLVRRTTGDITQVADAISGLDLLLRPAE